MLKNGKEDFIQRTVVMEFFSRGEFNSEQEQVEIHSQGAGWELEDEKLLKGNIRDKGDSGQTYLTGFWMKTGQDNKI